MKKNVAPPAIGMFAVWMRPGVVAFAARFVLRR
jgi:hypothetical protein